MGARNQETTTADPLEDLFEPGLGELSEEELEAMAPLSSGRLLLAEKRHRAEQRLEARRLRDELGDYDLDVDDF